MTSLETRILRADNDRVLAVESQADPDQRGISWEWIDIVVDEGGDVAAKGFATSLGLDTLAFRDAVYDFDLPKVDDLGSQMLIVLHGLHPDRIATCSVSCFLSDKRLVTVRLRPTPSLDVLHDELLVESGVTVESAGDLLALMADTFGRRHLSILAAFEDRVEGLVESALAADSEVIAEVTAIRQDLAVIAHTARPQRETLDQLRVSRSQLISNAAKRHFSDAFDVSQRVVHDVEAARESLREILEGYRGAEAAKATEVARVLTLFAALFLPITFITGFYGMIFPNLPFGSVLWGWALVTGLMLVVTVLSIRMFISKGWMRRPLKPKSAGEIGLNDAIRAPVQIADFHRQPNPGSVDNPGSAQVE